MCVWNASKHCFKDKRFFVIKQAYRFFLSSEKESALSDCQSYPRGTLRGGHTGNQLATCNLHDYVFLLFIK